MQFRKRPQGAPDQKQQKRNSHTCVVLFSSSSVVLAVNDTKMRDGHTTTVLYSSWMFSLFVVFTIITFYSIITMTITMTDTQSAPCVCACVDQCSVLRAGLLKGEAGKSQ